MGTGKLQNSKIPNHEQDVLKGDHKMSEGCWTIIQLTEYMAVVLVLHQFHGGMRVRQGWVLASLLSSIFSVAVIHVVFTRFYADKDTIDPPVGLRGKAGTRGRGVATAEEPSPATSP